MLKTHGDGSLMLHPSASLSISSPSNSINEKSLTQGDNAIVDSPSAFYDKTDAFPRLEPIKDFHLSYTSSPLSSAPPASQQQFDSMEIEVVEDSLPILPLLYYFAHNISTVQKPRLLRLVLLPTEARSDLLKAEPSLVELLAWRRSSPPPTEYIEAKIQHLDYTSLQLLITAYKQDQERLTSVEKIRLGLEIGKLGLEMLTCMQIDVEKDARQKARLHATQSPAAVRSGPDDERRKFSKVSSGDISLGRTPASPSPVSPLPASRKINNNLCRRTSSSRLDLFETPTKGGTPKSEGRKRRISPLVEEGVDIKQVEASNLIKGIEGILSASINLNNSSGGSSAVRGMVLELKMLQAQLDVIQGGIKYGIKNLQALVTSIANDLSQSHIYYRAALLLAGWESEASKDLMPALHTLQALVKRAQKCRDDHVALIASVAKLRLILASSYFDVAQAAVDEVAELLMQAGIDPKGKGEMAVDLQKLQPVLAVMLAHFLVLAIPWETRRGRFATSADYLAYLHQLMDRSEAINAECEVAIGLLTVPLGPIAAPTSQTMILEITPTSVLFELTFLISCIGHSDVMGSKPKRLIYVSEGLTNIDYVYTSTAAQLARPSDTGLSNIISIRREIQAVQAELLLDLAGLHIFTASFIAAEESLNSVISLVRNHDLFDTYSPRICLLQGQKYHMLGKKKEAITCYEACQYISNPGSEIDLVARASLQFIRIADTNHVDLAERASDVNNIKNELCHTETLLYAAAGRLLEAVTTDSIQRSKKLLGSGLETTIKANNNQARALYLAIASSHYRDTMQDSCIVMLKTASTIVRKLGTTQGQDGGQGEKLGPAGLGLWIAERIAELTTRSDPELAAKNRDRITKYKQLKHTQAKIR